MCAKSHVCKINWVCIADVLQCQVSLPYRSLTLLVSWSDVMIQDIVLNKTRGWSDVGNKTPALLFEQGQKPVGASLQVDL